MAETLTTTLNAQLISTLALADSLGVGQYPLALTSLLAVTLATGTGANKANQLYVSQRTLASSATEDINLYSFAGALDPLGQAYALATVKMLIIQNTSATASDYLSVGGKNTTAAWVSLLKDKTDIVFVRGGGSLIAVAPDATGFAVVNTTNHLLTILNSGAGSVSYNIIVVGATA